MNRTRTLGLLLVLCAAACSGGDHEPVADAADTSTELVLDASVEADTEVDDLGSRGPEGRACGPEGRVVQFPVDAGLNTFTRCNVCTCTSGAFACTEHPLAECPLKSCKTGDVCTDANVECWSGLGCSVTHCKCDSGKLSCRSTAC